MTIERRVVPVLRLALVGLFALLLVFQTLSLPGQFAYMADRDPDMAYLRWPATAITIFWVLCAQVVIVCTWHLLTLVRDDRIFTASSRRWVDTIIGAVAAAAVVLFGVLLYVGLNADDPGLPMLLTLALAGITVFGLLLVVMRSLLLRATSLRTDLDAVI